MNLGNALNVKAENRSVSMIGGSLAYHNRKPPSIVLDAGDSMSIIAYAIWPISCADTWQWKQASYIWTWLYFLNSPLCDCGRCYFQPRLINMCHIRCEKYSQKPFMPFDTLAIIQLKPEGCCHQFYGPSFTNYQNVMNHPMQLIINDIDLDVAYNWRPFHTECNVKKQDKLLCPHNKNIFEHSDVQHLNFGNKMIQGCDLQVFDYQSQQQWHW